MSRVGIIGGTFDPIHLAHIYIAKEAKRKLGLKKVIFMPAGIQPLKTHKKVTEAPLRLKMVEEAIKGIENFEVSKYEIEKEGKSYTYETLQHFNELYGELYFITGADCLLDIHKWREVEKIFSLCKFVVFTRPGFDNGNLEERKKFVEEKYNGEVIIIEVDGMNLSSTEIRDNIENIIKEGELIPSGVLKIIKENHLYGV